MDMDTKTKITLVWELHQSGISNRQIARDLRLNHETVGNYIRGINQQGLLPFLEFYRSAPRKPRPSRQVPISVKPKVWFLRDREGGCCGQKIAYFLAKEEDITLSVPKIYEILDEKYTLGGNRRRKRQKRGPVPEAAAPREVVQMDTVDFGKVFAFTAVDIFSKEADIYLAPALTSFEGKNFLFRALPLRFSGFVSLIQTDANARLRACGGSEFEGDFAQAVSQFCQQHRISRPYKKNEQAFIESFNRTVRSECLGWDQYRPEEIPALQKEVDTFLERYHYHYHRPHLGLEPLRPPLPRES